MTFGSKYIDDMYLYQNHIVLNFEATFISRLTYISADDCKNYLSAIYESQISIVFTPYRYIEWCIVL